MQLMRYGYDIIDGQVIKQDILIQIPAEELDNPDGRYETCAICKNKLYPECTSRCAILKRDLKADLEELD